MSNQSNVLRPGQSTPASGQYVLSGRHDVRETTYEVRVPAELLKYGYQAQDIQR